MRHSRSSGAAPSGRVSRSRAMPVGDRRSRPSEPPHLLGVRAETGAILTVGVSRRRGPAGRCADRRSAFPCLPGHLSQWGPRRDGSHPDGWGFGRPCGPSVGGRRFALCRRSIVSLVLGLGAALTLEDGGSGRVSRSRAMPVGAGRGGSPSVVRRVGRMEPMRVSRCAGRRPALQSSRLFSCGARRSRLRLFRGDASRYGPRGEPSRRLGFRPPRPCAPARCRSETGAPGVSLLAAPPREAGGPGRRPPWGGTFAGS